MNVVTPANNNLVPVLVILVLIRQEFHHMTARLLPRAANLLIIRFLLRQRQLAMTLARFPHRAGVPKWV